MKSTAILFGRFDKMIIGILQLMMILMLLWIGLMVNLSDLYWSLLLAGALFVYQQRLMADRERDPCFQAFMNNNYVGFILFLGMLVSYL